MCRYHQLTIWAGNLAKQAAERSLSAWMEMYFRLLQQQRATSPLAE